MATLIWSEDKIIEAMIKYRKTNGKWPKSRDWWYANKGRWPSFTTVCNRGLKWSGLLKKAKEIEQSFILKGTLPPGFRTGYPIAILSTEGELKFEEES